MLTGEVDSCRIENAVCYQQRSTSEWHKKCNILVHITRRLDLLLASELINPKFH